MSCNFGLKSSLRFQIELVLRGRPILKSRKISNLLHSTQFNYHYKYAHGWMLDKHYITFLVVYCCPFASEEVFWRILSALFTIPLNRRTRLKLIFLNGSSARAISPQKFASLHCPALQDSCCFLYLFSKIHPNGPEVAPPQFSCVQNT